jgi:DNA-binding NtrC family response regulator
LEKVYADYPSIPVIVITAVNEVQIALRAVKLGAYEFITKPPDTDRLFLTIRRALAKKLLETERDSLRKTFIESKTERRDFSEILTDSPVMHKVFELVEIFAPTNETVLIAGETGTGKDLIARKIHELSPRRKNPFVAVNLIKKVPLQVQMKTKQDISNRQTEEQFFLMKSVSCRFHSRVNY